MVLERYLTVSIVKRNIDEARTYFARVGTDLVTHLAKLSSVAAELSTPDRLRLLRDFFKAGTAARIRLRPAPARQARSQLQGLALP